MKLINCIAVLMVLICSCGKPKLLEKIDSSSSGLEFKNTITENDSINPLDMVNIYNGGGVGVGDFNNDALQDLYFTGNMVANKLFLNKGDLTFEDITQVSGTDGKGKWNRGVSVVDINNDGWLDIYVCATISKDAKKRENLLYVNVGKTTNGVPQFTEQAAAYGLNDSSHSTMANFFDYDNDGDLDMYLVVNEIDIRDNPNRYRPVVSNGTSPSTDKLYRNDKNKRLNHPFFTDVSRQSGITIEGLGHSATIADLNNDGWKDIYVSNDFVSSNILYVNNHDGTFTDQSRSYFKHTSANSMGQDIIDINNDGLSDVIEADMNPEDNFRKKMMMSANSYQTYQNFDRFNYQYQYVRNTLQLNCGPRVLQNDTIGAPIFSEIGYLSGIAETDWSWTPLVADFDNDGLRDMIITNGYPRDVTDHDFIAFRNQSYSIASKQQILEQIPAVKLPNYAFKNNGDLTFTNVSENWGINVPSFSNGAVYADLDNDGDLDLVINNINDEVSLYKNNVNPQAPKSNFLKITFQGSRQNRNGLGAWAQIYYDHGKIQAYENTPYRGYLSSIESCAHFGLGKYTAVDSLVIRWPDGKTQLLKDVKSNQNITVKYADAKPESERIESVIASKSLFKEITSWLGIDYQYKDQDFIDFNIQKLLPHKFSQYAPALAVGDLDGNGLEDMVVGGSYSNPAKIFFQNTDGRFISRDFTSAMKATQGHYQDLGILVFDADNDKDLDVYMASGGYENAPNSSSYQDKLYLNDGKGNFQLSEGALPKNYTSKFCVRASDYDRDGDLDLFVSGRVDPWSYPKPVSSYIFRNDSKNGKVKFTDVTHDVATALSNVGMVCDAVFSDFDNDGWEDLILAGEWMPVTFLKNNKGKFSNVSQASGVNDKKGWWNTIAPGDFDNDGDIDYIIGNQGNNTFYKASEEFPAFITAKDFDNNGSFDAIPSLFLPDETGKKKEFPAHTRDDMVKQIISTRVKFQNYKSYATATMDDIFPKEMRKGALRLKANYLLSGFFRNDGGGKFTVSPLPVKAQVSVLNGIAVDDFDGDGNLDAVINGNDFGTEVSIGRYDALNGLFLKGNGKGEFKPLSILESGIFIPGNGKALVKLKGANGKYLLAASQNRGPLKVFSLKTEAVHVPVKTTDKSALIQFADGRLQKREFYFGSSFLSQSSKALDITSKYRSVTITDVNGKTRQF